MFLYQKSDFRLHVLSACHLTRSLMNCKKSLPMDADLIRSKSTSPCVTCISNAASFKGTAEKLVGTLGVIGGILAGLFAAIVLLVRWRGTGEGNLILKLFAGGVFGLGIFLIVWAVVALSVAPLFAEPESKEARNAVRITRYWPSDKVVQLEFQNEQLAEIVGAAN